MKSTSSRPLPRTAGIADKSLADHSSPKPDTMSWLRREVALTRASASRIRLMSLRSVSNCAMNGAAASSPSNSAANSPWRRRKPSMTPSTGRWREARSMRSNSMSVTPPTAETTTPRLPAG